MNRTTIVLLGLVTALIVAVSASPMGQAQYHLWRIQPGNCSTNDDYQYHCQRLVELDYFFRAEYVIQCPRELEVANGYLSQLSDLAPHQPHCFSFPPESLPFGCRRVVVVADQNQRAAWDAFFKDFASADHTYVRKAMIESSKQWAAEMARRREFMQYVDSQGNA